MQKLTTLSLLSVVSVLLFSAPVLRAQTVGVGVQFYSGGTALTPDQQAGVVAIGNYNTVSGSSGSNVSLVNSSGLASGITMSFSSSYTFQSYSQPGSPSNDQILTSGGLTVNQTGHSATLTLSNISYSSYDVYVFLGPNNGNGGTFFHNTVTDGTTTYYSSFPAGQFPGWTPGTSTDSSTFTPNATYVVFSGETASSLTLSLTALENGACMINGFEIIDTSGTSTVPEPSVSLLIGLGLGTLFLRRRMKQTGGI